MEYQYNTSNPKYISSHKHSLLKHLPSTFLLLSYYGRLLSIVFLYSSLQSFIFVIYLYMSVPTPVCPSCSLFVCLCLSPFLLYPSIYPTCLSIYLLIDLLPILHLSTPYNLYLKINITVSSYTDMFVHNTLHLYHTSKSLRLIISFIRLQFYKIYFHFF